MDKGGTGLTTLTSGSVLVGNGTGNVNLVATTGSGNFVRATSPTLTTPVIAQIVNTGTLTLPTSTDTLVGRATTDTLTDKTLTAPVMNGNITGTYTLAGTYTLGGTPTFPSDIVTTTGTQTLTNKTRVRRLVTVNAPGATPSTNVNNLDIANFTGLNTAITSMTTNLSGTPVDGQLVEFRFTDDGTGRGITWGASFGSTTVTLPTTTVSSTMLRVLVEYNGSIWQCLAVA